MSGGCEECGDVSDVPTSGDQQCLARFDGRPVCVGFECVECRDDAECAEAAGKPFCQRQSCVACRSDRDCPTARPVCSATGTCITRCRRASDCPGGRPCRDGRCGCEFDADCPADRPICLNDLCIECIFPDDCADERRPFCVGNACVECVGNDNGPCGPASTCVNNVCKCADATTSCELDTACACLFDGGFSCVCCPRCPDGDPEFGFLCEEACCCGACACSEDTCTAPKVCIG